VKDIAGRCRRPPFALGEHRREGVIVHHGYYLKAAASLDVSGGRVEGVSDKVGEDRRQVGFRLLRC
jgi:hypothetical protein